MAIPAGARLGPYEVVGPLGVGGMGEVYRARDPRLGRDVAIKVLPAEVASDASRLRRFEKEARAASALNHPNIVTIYDIGQTEGMSWISMERVDGKTLRETLFSGALPIRKLLPIAAQIADGLARAHEAGIVHRDLKPENVMVTRAGLVKILDFGLAKQTSAISEIGETSHLPTETGTSPGVVLGTVGYMSPEQARGFRVDFRSDHFSFGSLLYEMVTGQRAFQKASVVDTLSAILHEDPRPVAQINPDASAPLRRIVERCLAKDPEERYGATRDLAHDLAALRDHLSEASVPDRTAPAVRTSRGIRTKFLLATALAAAAAVGLFVALRGAAGPSAERSGAPIQSIAVLPLENLSRDPEQEYFADGMTEALTTDLAQIGALRVISRTSVMSYKGKRKSLREIGRELNVDAIVEGSVMRAGDRVRITAQLIHAPTDRHLWARSYERELRDVLGLQEEVARAIAGEIRVKTSPEHQVRASKARPVDPHAQEAYFQGRFHLFAGDPDHLKKALEYFQNALETDPGYGRAYAGAATAYLALGNSGVLAGKLVYTKAKEAAQKALELDDTLAETHAALAVVRGDYDRDQAGAEREFRRALELNPSDRLSHWFYALYLMKMGRHEEAINEADRVRELDPLWPGSQELLGLVFDYARQHDRAIELYRKTLKMDPNLGLARFHLWLAHVYKGMYEEAIAEINEWMALYGRRADFLSLLGVAYARAGKRDEAARILKSLKQEHAGGAARPYLVAAVSAALDEKDQAIEWLEKGYEERDDWLTWIKIDPVFDPLRHDSRFQDLQRRLGLPQ